MIYSYLSLFISIFVVGVFSIASYSDIQSREVPDFLSYLLLAGGLLLNLSLSIATGSISNLIFMPLSILLLFGFAYTMYYFGQWGGGDVKLMLGLSVVFTSFSLYSNFSFFGLFINMLIFGGLYGLFGTIIFGLLKFRHFKKLLHYYDILLVIVGTVGMVFFFSYFPSPINYLAMFATLLLVSMRYIYLIAENLMYMEVPINKLTEGDWLADDVKKDNVIVVKRRNTGLDLGDIKKLKESKVNRVLVKIGLPFVPGLLLGVIVTLVLGNPLLQILSSSVIF
ncbi:prepilin peptidase [Candidatus Parvarchaeota archaeon]|nr:prepilin peptidase [Candidatus Parvarchaeota archaeon]